MIFSLQQFNLFQHFLHFRPFSHFAEWNARSKKPVHFSFFCRSILPSLALLRKPVCTSITSTAYMAHITYITHIHPYLTREHNMRSSQLTWIQRIRGLRITDCRLQIADYGVTSMYGFTGSPLAPRSNRYPGKHPLMFIGPPYHLFSYAPKDPPNHQSSIINS